MTTKTKIFLTGATGYIGGSVLAALLKDPKYEIAVLLRSVPDKFLSTPGYEALTVVKGDYDSAEILSDAASKANIVVHNGDSDHEPSIKALIAGLLRRSEPSFLIHLGGTGVVGDWHDTKQPRGELNNFIWSDINHLNTPNGIWQRPDNELHRNVDKIIYDTAIKHADKIKTAIVCPPDVYGKGRGLGRTLSGYMIPMLAEQIIKLGHPFFVGSGNNTRSWVHIDDLMQVYVALVKAASEGGGNAEWGKDGYYFTGTQEINHIETSKLFGKVLKAKGKIETAEPKQISLEALDSLDIDYPGFPNIARYFFSSNSRTRADRATKLLGYKPHAPGLFESVEEDITAALE